MVVTCYGTAIGANFTIDLLSTLWEENKKIERKHFSPTEHTHTHTYMQPSFDGHFHTWFQEE